MNRLATILRLVALSAAIVAVFIYLTARKHFAGKAEEFQRIETVYEQTQKELQEAALTIQAHEEIIAHERIELSENKQKVALLESALNKSQQDKELTLDTLKKTKRKLQNITFELNKTRNLLLQATRKSSDVGIHQRIADLEANIETLYTENLTLKDELQDARERVVLLLSPKKTQKDSQLLDPNYRPDTSSISTKAEVTSINQKNNIIVFSVASDIGLEPGLELNVMLNNKLLGKIQIFKVTESYTVASILENFKTQDLDAGSEITIIR